MLIDPSPLKYLWRRKFQSHLFPYPCCINFSLMPSFEYDPSSHTSLWLFQTLICRLQWCDRQHEVFFHGVIYDPLWLCLILLVIGSSWICNRFFDHRGHKRIMIMLFENVDHSFLPCVEVWCAFKSIFWLDGFRFHFFNIFSMLQYPS